MDDMFIERLIVLFGQSSLIELDYSSGGTTLHLKRTLAPQADVQPQSSAPPPAPGPPTPNGAASAEPQTHMIAAGLVATFHRRPAPNLAPFVNVGDRVSEGQQLGILEAMKMLMPVEADRAGIVREILQDDSAPVAAGTPLFLLSLTD